MRLITTAAVAAAVAILAAGAAAAPSPITLTFDGAHVPDSILPAQINHKGRFTASPPLCAAGRAEDTRDVELEPLTVLRTHYCDDGSGSFTALLPTARNEHGGIGEWTIVEGTGRYASLRGKGTYTGHLLSGDPTIFATIVYRTNWEGVVDFDSVAPTVDVTATAKKVRRPARTYSVRTVLDARGGHLHGRHQSG